MNDQSLLPGNLVPVQATVNTIEKGRLVSVTKERFALN
jgi:hypothetical protein